MPEDGWSIFCCASVSKRWNKVRSLVGSIPMPSSTTEIVTLSVCFVTSIVIAFSAGVYLNALDIRLKNIFSNLSRSIHAYIDLSSLANRKLIFFSSAIKRKLIITFSRSGIRSVFSTSTFIFWFCILRKSRIWFMRRSIRSAFFCTTVKCSRAVADKSSFSRTSLTGLLIRVSGVRSSWDMSVKKRSLILDSCCSISTWWRNR